MQQQSQPQYVRFMRDGLHLDGLELHYVSQPFYEGMPAPNVLPTPAFRPLERMCYEDVQVTRFEFHSHLGTHIDAPAHFVPDGLTIDQLPAEAFIGDAVVVRVRKAPGEAITADDMAMALDNTSLHSGDMLLLSTGWAEKYGMPAYTDHPHLTEHAAEWMVARGIRLLGIDMVTPDLSIPRRPAGYSHAVHRYLLPRGVLIVENLASLEPFEGQRVLAAFLPLYIKGTDGAPVVALIGLRQ